MHTRSKTKIKESSTPSEPEPEIIEYEDMDEDGNLVDLVVNDLHELKPTKKKRISPKHKKMKGKPGRRPLRTPRNSHSRDEKLNDMFVSYLILKATEKANADLKDRKRSRMPRSRSTPDILTLGPSVQSLSLDLDVDPTLQPSTPKSSVSSVSSVSSSVSTYHKGKIMVEESDIDSIQHESDGHHSDSESSAISSESDDEEEYIDDDDDGDIYEDDMDDMDDMDDGDDDGDDDDDDDDEAVEYDEYDEKYEDMLISHSKSNTDEHDIEYYHALSIEKKQLLMDQTKEIYEMNDKNTPLRFKVIESTMEMKTKAVAMENIDKLNEMDVSTGEHSKMDLWINGLLKIPFGKYKELQIGPSNTDKEKRDYLLSSFQTLDNAIYGHKEAKTHILQVLGKWIQNPQSGGNVLAIQGPMGNGKTTLVKEGIAKVLDRPFAFIALGGASDSAFFDGHCYTYEGSHWGRIVQILQDSKCMNPVFYFDELDKVSETQKGEEIIHMLTHLTDSSQNSLFQDNYFPGIDLDLSKALFIFSYNDEAKVNKILKDRMYVIHTKGFNETDKLKICHNYLFPDIFKTYYFKEKILFDDDIIRYIIQSHTNQEEGVRNLKRCLESIVSKVNIFALTHTDDNDSSINETLSFTIPDFKLPLHITRDHVDKLLPKSTTPVPFGMYS